MDSLNQVAFCIFIGLMVITLVNIIPIKRKGR